MRSALGFVPRVAVPRPAPAVLRSQYPTPHPATLALAAARRNSATSAAGPPPSSATYDAAISAAHPAFGFAAGGDDVDQSRGGGGERKALLRRGSQQWQQQHEQRSWFQRLSPSSVETTFESEAACQPPCSPRPMHALAAVTTASAALLRRVRVFRSCLVCVACASGKPRLAIDCACFCI
jgi:hypothetical protein